MQWLRIVNNCGYPALSQKLLQIITTVRKNRVDVKDMGRIDRPRQGKWQFSQAARVALSDFPATSVPEIDVLELHAEHCRLKFVEARILAVQIVKITALD